MHFSLLRFSLSLLQEDRTDVVSIATDMVDSVKGRAVMVYITIYSTFFSFSKSVLGFLLCISTTYQGHQLKTRNKNLLLQCSRKDIDLDIVQNIQYSTFSIKILCSRSEMQAQVHESEEPDLFFSILKSLIVLKVCLNPTFVFVLSIKYCNCPYSVVLLAQLSVCIDMQGGRSTVYKNSTDKEKQNASLFRIQGLGYESVQAIEVDLVSITVRSKILYQNLHFLLFFYLNCRFRLH